MSKAKTFFYRRDLSTDQIESIKEHAKNGFFVPTIAKMWSNKLTINQVLHILKSEGCGQYIKFQKYGDKKYNWKDPATVELLKRLMYAGNDDDQIAALMHTSFFAIARGRSTAGLVAYNKIVAKGHHSKHEFQHTISTENAKQGDLFRYSDPRIFGKKDAQTVINNDKETILINEREQANKWNEIITVCFDKNDNVPTHVKKTIVERISWRSVCMRVQNPQHFYEIVDSEVSYYYQQIQVDPYHNLVTLKLVKRVTSKIAEEKVSL